MPVLIFNEFDSIFMKSNKSSAIAEMGDRLATIDMGRHADNRHAVLLSGGWVPMYPM